MKKLKQYLTFFFFVKISILIGQPISDFEKEKLTPGTLAIVDSTLAANHPNNGVFIAYGLSGKPAEQYTYWLNHSPYIPINDFYILKNHPSPIIRYYVYQKLLSRNTRGSKYDFILHHLEDVEVVRLSSGCVAQQKPVILYFIEIYLNPWEKEVLSKYIVLNPVSTPHNQFNQFAIDHCYCDEGIYNNIKTSAKKGNITALTALIKYKKLEDEEFILQKLNTLFSSKETRKSGLQVLRQAYVYNAPSNAVNVLFEFHEQAKQNNQLNEVVKDFPELYNSIVIYKHPKRQVILEELLEHDVSPRKVLSFSGRDRSGEMLDLQFKIWEKYYIVHKVTFEKLRKTFPEKIYPLVKRDLEAMINGEKRNLPCYEKFIYILKSRNEPIEKYINWALTTQQKSGLATIALKNLNSLLFPSSKKLVLALLKNENNFHTCKNVLTVLEKYELSQSDKKLVREWYMETGKNFMYDKKIRQFDMEASLEKMKIKI